MQYTFEITVAGCNTRCKHCYISGGPAKSMKLDAFQYCLTHLRPVLERLEGDIAVTLGNEPFLHPQAKEVFSAAYAIVPEYFFYDDFDYPTTGIALASRRDREDVLQFLDHNNYRRVMLTLHGNPQHHNDIVCNPNAYTQTKNAAELFHAHGMSIECNLMLNRYLVEDWDQVLDSLESMHCNHAHITIPLYLPVDRLRAYQPLRPQLEDCLPLLSKMNAFGLDPNSFQHKLTENCEQAVMASHADGWDYRDAERSQPQWTFFHIDQDLNLYYGNVGQHIKLLGNLKNMTEEALYRSIIQFPANFNYSAYYQIEAIPPFEVIRERLSPLQTNYVYPDAESCLYRWLDQCGIPTRLIP